MVIVQQHSQTGAYPRPIRTTTQCEAGDPLEDMKARPQWVAWRWGNVRKDGKREKVPINPSTRLRASVTAPKTWGTYQQALACAQEHGYKGVGFVLTADDPYFMLDLDKCRDPETGVIHPAALALVEELDTFTEVSPSGTGIRIIGVGTKPGSRCVSKNIEWPGQIEIYDQAHYCTITENTVGERGSFVRDSQDALDSVYREFFPAPEKPAQPPVRMDTNPAQDGELLKAGRNAKELGPKFRALFDRGDISWSGNDASKADNALMSQLAYLTWHDAARMEALFSQSALGRRDKWIDRPDYRKRTIDYAIKKTSGRYDPENEKYKPREGSTKTRDKLREIHRYMMGGYRWTENAGNAQSAGRDYAAFLVMLRAAWRANSLEIDMNGRDLMVAGGFGKRATAAKALTSLQDTHRWCVKVADAKGAKADRYRITPHVDSKVDQALIAAPSILGQSRIEAHPIGDQALIGEKPHTLCVYEFGPLLGKSVLIRNTSPTTNKEFDKNGRRIVKGKAAPVASVGKVAAWVLDLIHFHSRVTGEPAPLEFLEERTDIRRDHIKSRHVRKLLEAGLILEDSGGYTTPENVRERLERELEISGCDEKKRQDEEKNAKDREISLIHRMRKAGADFDRIAAQVNRSVAFIMDVLKIPDLAPSYDDLDSLRERREIRNADGYIEELERASELWSDTFPEPESEQEPLGHEYAPAPPPPEPRESRLRRSEEAPRGNVPPARASESRSLEDEHPLECDCLECSFPAIRFARHDYASLVT